MSTAARALDLPPGFKFKPNADQLIRWYLLPRALGQAAGITGVVIEDEGTGAAVPPWELLARHGRTNDDEVYFVERIGKDDGNRGCGAEWTWVSQRCTQDQVLRLPGGEEVSWNKRDLNLHRGRGKRTGSTGWVMHEYKIVSPPCPFPVKLCHVAFTGHGEKRQRVPEDFDGADQPRPCKRAAAAASSYLEASKTTFPNQQLLSPFGQVHGCFLNQQQPHGFDQEQLQSYEGSSIPTHWSSDAGSTHEICAWQQELAYNDNQQQQSQNHVYEAYTLQPAPDTGASQEPLAAGPLLITQYQEQLWQQQFNHLGILANAETAYHEEHVQMTTGSLPPPPPPTGLEEVGTLTDPGSPAPWEDPADAFCRDPDNIDFGAFPKKNIDFGALWDDMGTAPEELQGAT